MKTNHWFSFWFFILQKKTNGPYGHPSMNFEGTQSAHNNISPALCPDQWPGFSTSLNCLIQGKPGSPRSLLARWVGPETSKWCPSHNTRETKPGSPWSRGWEAWWGRGGHQKLRFRYEESGSQRGHAWGTINHNGDKGPSGPAQLAGSHPWLLTRRLWHKNLRQNGH